jgi:hypothetical protein
LEILKKKARVAGALYLLLAITSIFGLVYVPSKIIVKEDPLATINNIITSPSLYKLGIISNMIYLIVFVFLVLAFYDLFKDINKKLGMLMVALVLVAIPVAFVNELIKSAALVLLGGSSFLQAFQKDQLNAMILLFLNLNEYGSYMVMIFWGLWLLPLGLLILKSKFIPPIFGYLLIMGCIGYSITSIVYMYSPQSGKSMFSTATLPGAVGEISIILWLLIKGVKAQKTDYQRL